MIRTQDAILDELLVLRCQGGESAALGELLKRWHGRMLERAKVLLRHDADAADAVQEAMIGVSRSINRLEDAAMFGPWCYRIVANKCADIIKQRQRSRRVDQIVENQNGPSDESQIENMRLAIETLPLEMQAILSMRYSREMSTAEIAAALGIREGTVKSRLHHARNELKSTFDRLYGKGEQ